MADVRVVDSTLHLDGLILFARGGTGLERVPSGTDAVAALKGDVLDMAREQGLSRIEVSYVRFFEGGAVRKPRQLRFDVE